MANKELFWNIAIGLVSEYSAPMIVAAIIAVVTAIKYRVVHSVLNILRDLWTAWFVAGTGWGLAVGTVAFRVFHG